MDVIISYDSSSLFLGTALQLDVSDLMLSVGMSPYNVCSGGVFSQAEFDAPSQCCAGGVCSAGRRCGTAEQHCG
jgi:hypothetical protein